MIRQNFVQIKIKLDFIRLIWEYMSPESCINDSEDTDQNLRI